VNGPTPTTDGGLRLVLTHPFSTVEEANALLQSMNGGGGPLHGLALGRVETAHQVTTTLTGTLRVDGGLSAFADADLLKTLGAGPYAASVAQSGVKPGDAFTFTLHADLPGTITSPAGSADTTPATSGSAPPSAAKSSRRTFTVKADGTAVDAATTAVYAKPESHRGWRTVEIVALGAVLAWAAGSAVVAAAAAVRQRRSRA
jgi:hypothetical protein